MGTQLRHESKHYISVFDYYVIRERLKLVTEPDENVNSEGFYQVRSLYFDNLYDKVLKEKLYGINQREKFRIRFYNDNYSEIKLEKKSKKFGLCGKEVSVITKKECEELLNGNTRWMLDVDDKLKQEIYAKMQYQLLKPRTIVDYRREPYIFKAGNVRVTFDYDIRSGLYSKDFFNMDLSSIPVAENMIIMEVKYDAYLPDIIKDMIATNQRQASAYSKYAGCRIYG